MGKPGQLLGSFFNVFGDRRRYGWEEFVDTRVKLVERIEYHCIFLLRGIDGLNDLFG